ncbi:MAG: rod shape-determining protein MreC, partial [Candidatus Eremiobacterota bacterium]
DRGGEDGVAADMVAVSSQGLVGRIYAVSPGASRVRFILDPRSAVPVMLEKSGAVGVLYGQGGYYCTVQFLDHSVEVQEGEGVLTSGMGNVYPRGLLVGRVVRNYGRTEALFQSVQVRPAVDFGRLHEVMLLTRDQAR